MKKAEQIVIIGGGFAGLQLAKRLHKTGYRVMLVDKQNHHQFQPLFYHVASARLEPSSISFPFRKIFQNARNVDIRLAEVKRIVPERSCIETTIGDIHFDQLVIATGCTTNYFGNAQISSKALPMKTTQEAIEIRNNVLLSFERALSATGEEKEALFNIVIVGAGPTGVELSGAFAEMKNNVLPKDYPFIDFSGLNIILLEGSKSTLNSMSDASKKTSRKYLEQLGVTVRTETFVTGYDGTTVTLNNGETIKSKNLIWAAGVTGNVIEGIDLQSVTRNRFIVDRYNKVQGYPNIYAIGDVAYMQTPKYPHGHPQVANVAINQGKNLAGNFLRMVKGKAAIAYEYRDLGSMATIGKHKAVVDLPFIRFQGRMAWYVWMMLHLMLILSVRNKLIIFFNWAWSYFTRDSSLRLILKPR